MLRAAAIVVLCIALWACQTNPKQTVLALDTTDPQWTSAKCVAARKAVADYNDHGRERDAAALAGAVAGMPVAGAAASAAMTAAQQDEREDLNNEVRAACISDPLRGKK